MQGFESDRCGRPLRVRPLLFVWIGVLAFLAGLPARATTLTFRDGVAGYSSTRDTYLEQNTPSTGHGTSTILRWDADHPAGTGRYDYVLLRFDGIVGSAPDQVPEGALVNSAVLTYSVSDTGDAGELHEAFALWSETSTFASFCGAGCGGTQIGPLLASVPGAVPGAKNVDVTSSLQAWVNGAANLGWVFVPLGSDGVEIASRENPTLGNRPFLRVTFDEAPPVTVVRAPYLQSGTPTSMTVVWRTDAATDSRVHYGTTQGNLDHALDVLASSVQHVVTLTGLAPATRYYYDVGSTTQVLSGGSAEHYFTTSPPPGSTTPFRVWVVGDCGVGDFVQAQVRDAMLSVAGGVRPDLSLHVGDIAYTNGSENEFTAYHFTPYQDILRHTVLWPTLGNHEGTATSSGDPGPSIGPYYDAFVLPTDAEAGGEPSATEAYYSFDYANVHFISLNSFQVNRSSQGTMAAWLDADLAATQQPWIIAYWHHPPYTHGTHNSDFEIELAEMRANLLPLLEARGVDLVLGGHSHGYERSYLIDGTYASPTPDLPTLIAGGNVIDIGDGNPAGDGAYKKTLGTLSHEGAVYVVAGHGGAVMGGNLDHPAMRSSESVHGSLLLDIHDDTLELRNVRSTGEVGDSFSIVKRPAVTPLVERSKPARDSSVPSLPTIEVTFNEAVSGVDAADLTVNGVPAVSVLFEAPYRYRFTLPQSPPGTASVVLAPGGITSTSSTSLAFAGDSWTYQIVCVAEPPPDVTGLRWQTNKSTFDWDDTAGLGGGGRYDLARGLVHELPVDGAASSVCLAASLGATTFTDATIPPVAGPSWYLVRGNSTCSAGTWGREGRQGAPTAERHVSACP